MRRDKKQKHAAETEENLAEACRKRTGNKAETTKISTKNKERKIFSEILQNREQVRLLTSLKS